MEILIKQGENEVGPFSWIEIFIMLQKRTITDDTLSKHSSDEIWQTIHELGLWREGREVGPFTWEDISTLVEGGCLDASVMIRIEGEDGISTLGEVMSRGNYPLRFKSFVECSPDTVTLVEGPAHNQTSSLFYRLLRKRLLLGFLIITIVPVVLVMGVFFSGFVQTEPQMADGYTLPLQSNEVAEQKALSPIQPEPATNIYPQSLAEDVRDAGDASSIENKTVDASSAQNVIQGESLQINREVSIGDSTEIVLNKENSIKNHEMPRANVGEQLEQSNAMAGATPAPLRQRDADNESNVADVKPQPAKPVDPENKNETSITERTRPFETPQLIESELEELLQERFSAPPIKIPDSYDERPAKGLEIHEGAFTLETKLIQNPNVEVIYRVPLRSKNNPGPDADNIVMVGLYHGGIQPRAKKMVDGTQIAEKSRLHGALMPFSDRLGYTAFTLHIATTPEMVSDRREYYAYGSTEWVDIVFRAKAEIERRHRLKSRKLLLTGASEGGQFVGNIAVASPGKVAAVAVHSGPSITPPESSSDIAWFLAITRGDMMQKAYEAVYNRLLDQDANVAFNIFPPNYKGRGVRGNFYHSQDPVAAQANRSFLRGVVDSYNYKGQFDYKQWPYIRDRTRPLRIYPVGSRQAKSISAENREYLPSRAFAQCLQAIPAQMQSVVLSANDGSQIKAFVGIPPLGKPKGVIIYSQALNLLDLAHMFDNIYYLAARGYVVIAPQFKKNDSNDILGTMRAVSESPSLGKLPVALLGYGQKANSAWDVIARNRNVTPKAVAMLEFTPKDSFDESKLPVGCRMEAPVVFIYDEQPLINVKTSQEVKKSKEIVASVSEFVTKCKERNQFARVVIVPKPEQKPTVSTLSPEEVAKMEKLRIAQLSLEAAENFITNVIEQKTSLIAP